MLSVPRGSFVPAEYQAEAYVDSPIRVSLLVGCKTWSCSALSQKGAAWCVRLLQDDRAAVQLHVQQDHNGMNRLCYFDVQVEEHDFNISAPHMYVAYLSTML